MNEKLSLEYFYQALEQKLQITLALLWTNYSASSSLAN